ncbi:hypothetical protein P167DRAFT_540128 [Morchella conica CCBAS932]|uniref:Uncharacterized protein n=1 Tax=Morchella conica CCBAS932 TaxID=1392247 RepID=A0A3N4KAA8_9PEZI|nr:hypothetical protein P167DRAFT_540128 [Morchella conica CCBAS932]
MSLCLSRTPNVPPRNTDASAAAHQTLPLPSPSTPTASLGKYIPGPSLIASGINQLAPSQRAAAATLHPYPPHHRHHPTSSTTHSTLQLPTTETGIDSPYPTT